MRIFVIIVIILNFLTPIAFSKELVTIDSAEGIRRLENSEAKIDFFPLANHFESQQNKVFCGIASSVIILNTLRLDNPNFVKPQDNSVLSKIDRKYFPKNFNPIYERYTQGTLLNTKTKARPEVLGKPVNINGKTINNSGLQLNELVALLSSYELDAIGRIVDEKLKDDFIKNELIKNLSTASDYVLINYSRKTLGQGDYGHISPLGAYDAKTDSFLIMDVNPNTSKWVWVKTEDLIAAMRTFDTIENRGYVLVKEKYSIN